MRSARWLLVSCAVAAAVSACSPRAPERVASPSPSPGHGRGPWLHITGSGTARQPLRFVASTKQNRKQYDLVARSYESNGAQGASVATFFVVHVIFYGSQGATMTANAARAVVDESANTITLLGDVHSRSSSGMALTCDALRYNRTSELIHGQGHVVMTDPHGMRASGNAVDSDLSMTHARMT